MLRASKYDKKSKDQHHPTKFTTRKQKADAKEKGDIRGWFAKMPRGRPKKEVNTEIVDKARCDMKRAADKLPDPPGKRMRNEEGEAYNKWRSTDEMFGTLKTAVMIAFQQPYALLTQVVAIGGGQC